MEIMKQIFWGIVIVMALVFLLILTLDSKSVRESEYNSCMITSTDKSICESLKD